jgi:hypothetical protein
MLVQLVQDLIDALGINRFAMLHTVGVANPSDFSPTPPPTHQRLPNGSPLTPCLITRASIKAL